MDSAECYYGLLLWDDDRHHQAFISCEVQWHQTYSVLWVSSSSLWAGIRWYKLLCPCFCSIGPITYIAASVVFLTSIYLFLVIFHDRLWTFTRKIERQISHSSPLHPLVWYIPPPFRPRNLGFARLCWVKMNDWVFFEFQVIRVLTPVYAAHLPCSPLPWRVMWMVFLFVITCIMLTSLKVLIGMGLRKHATWYINRCRRRNSSHLHND